MYTVFSLLYFFFRFLFPVSSLQSTQYVTFPPPSHDNHFCFYSITFNAVLDSWARSGDKRAPYRAEQILNHMEELSRSGYGGVAPDTYTYNTLINCLAKSQERGAASRAEQILVVMTQRYQAGDTIKPNCRTYTSVIDAHAKSGEAGAARRAEHLLNTMLELNQQTGDYEIAPNAHTANAVMNACAFTKIEADRPEALSIAFRVFEWLSTQTTMHPDAYTYTILLSVCSNLLPRQDRGSRYAYAQNLFQRCCNEGYVNDYVLRKLKQCVTEEEYLHLTDYRGFNASASQMHPSWTRNAKLNSGGRPRRGGRGDGGRGRR